MCAILQGLITPVEENTAWLDVEAMMANNTSMEGEDKVIFSGFIDISWLFWLVCCCIHNKSM